MSISSIALDISSRISSWVEGDYTYKVTRDSSGRPMYLSGISGGRPPISIQFSYNGPGGAFSGMIGSTSTIMLADLVRDANAAGGLPIFGLTDAGGNIISLVGPANKPTPSGGGGGTAVVNDLTTGGTTYPLSAEMGKTLNTAKAPLASPNLTGTPTAPTATAGTNTTQIATTAFAMTAAANAVATLVNSAPVQLDTLNELAAALGNDANFASTMTAALGAKAPLASPIFTGTPSAPTAAAGTNTTQIATTAFVTAAVAAATSGINHSPTAVADSYTFNDQTVSYAFNLLSNDTDPDVSDTLTVTSVTYGGTALTIGGATALQYGTLRVNSNGTGTFVPNATAKAMTAGQNATETISYTISDGHGGQASSVATFNITGTNGAPVVTNDIGSGPQDATLTGNVLTNDTDPEGTALTVTGFAVNSTNYSAGATATITSVGTITIASNGLYTFNPVSGYTGQVPTITYNVSDGVNSSQGTLSISISPVASPTAPLILYTDIINGPTTGGENNNGCYLSIFGYNFGTDADKGTNTKVFIGGVEVTRYISIGNSRVYGRHGIQRITVQVGAIGSPTVGQALPIQVLRNGTTSSNLDKTFTRTNGRILFLDVVNGNDSTAVVGDITKPWKTQQGSGSAVYTAGVFAQLQAGDHVILRGYGATNPYVTTGFEGYFIKFFGKAGSAAAGHIVIMGYPGEDVLIDGKLTNSMTGGVISGVNGQNYPNDGKYVVISNLRIQDEGYDGPISVQIQGHNWRVVNNDLSAPNAPRTGGSVPRMGGVTGNGNNQFWVGNYIHDIQGSSGECHGMYIDGDGSYELAYNQVEDVRDGNFLNIYVSGGNGSTETNNIYVHNNYARGISKHAFNIADNTHNNIKFINNVMCDVAYAGVRFNTSILANCVIANNSFFNVMSSGSSNGGLSAGIINDYNLPDGSITFVNNIMSLHAGMPFVGGGVNIAGSVFARCSNNVFFNGNGDAAPSFATASITADPLYNNTATYDLRIQTGSPCIDAGYTVPTSTATVDSDITSLVSRPQGNGYDIGAYEMANPNPALVSAPTLSGTAQVGASSSVSNGTWGNGPITGYTYQWGYSTTNGGSVTDIAGATSSSYTWLPAHQGKYPVCKVTATNASGSSTYTVRGGTVVAASANAPVVTANPTISGSTAVGSLLTCTSDGTATPSSGTYQPTSSRQWMRNGSAISGQTGTTYLTTTIDDAAAITCVVTWTNSQGTAVGTSNTITMAHTVAAPALVGSAVTVADANSGNTTVTLTKTVTAGNLLLVAFATRDGAYYSASFSDSAGGTNTDWTDQGGVFDDPFGPGVRTRVAPSSGSITVTLSKAGGLSYAAALIEVSNVDPAVVDGAMVSASFAASPASLTPSATSFAKDLILGVLAGEPSPYGTTYAPSDTSVASVEASAAGLHLEVHSRTTSAAGAQSAMSCTLAGSNPRTRYMVLTVKGK